MAAAIDILLLLQAAAIDILLLEECTGSGNYILLLLRHWQQRLHYAARPSHDNYITLLVQAGHDPCL